MNLEITQSTNSIDSQRVAELETRWGTSLQYIRNKLYPNAIDNRHQPASVLAKESQSNFTRLPDTQLLVGISGPGAAGKGTVGRFLTDELGYAKVVNTTTRTKREGETEGIDYFFMDRSQFTTAQNLGHFALTLERIGRGMYGIAHDEITRKLSETTAGCVIEENPANIMELFDNIQAPQTQAVLIYILPNDPVVKNSIARLEHRLSFETDPAKRVITPEVFESTLGDRQVDEFVSLVDLPKHPAISPIFIVNDSLQETKQTLTALLGATNGK